MTPSAAGGAAATVVIYLGANAPAGGWPVSLSSSNPGVASVPATVTVPAGTRYLQVRVTTTPQCSNRSVTLTASSGANTLQTTLTVTPPPSSSLSFVSSVRGGTPVIATVYVSYPACSSGIRVALQSSNPSVASVPANVTIAAGQKSATFAITTFSVSTPRNVTISATSDNATKSKVLTVTP